MIQSAYTVFDHSAWALSALWAYYAQDDTWNTVHNTCLLHCLFATFHFYGFDDPWSDKTASPKAPKREQEAADERWSAAAES
jgi:hypothetical protein